MSFWFVMLVLIFVSIKWPEAAVTVWLVLALGASKLVS